MCPQQKLDWISTDSSGIVRVLTAISTKGFRQSVKTLDKVRSVLCTLVASCRGVGDAQYKPEELLISQRLVGDN
jgi:hypothetical protein